MVSTEYHIKVSNFLFIFEFRSVCLRARNRPAEKKETNNLENKSWLKINCF